MGGRTSALSGKFFENYKISRGCNDTGRSVNQVQSILSNSSIPQISEMEISVDLCGFSYILLSNKKANLCHMQEIIGMCDFAVNGSMIPSDHKSRTPHFII